MMKQQKTPLNFAKVQSLYLLKIKAVETVRYLAVIIGRSESTIHEWLYRYKTGGIEELLEEHPKTGRPKKLELETVALVKKELSEPQGFNSYQEIKIWLFTCQDIDISYTTIHQLVRYELGAKLKVPRPYHEYQIEGVIEVFKKYLPIRIKGIISEIKEKWGNMKNICYWCQDETRLGFRTELGRKITLKGVKPEQELQWHYNYYYLYGLIEVKNGKSFFYELSHFNSECFGKYLEEFSKQYPDDVHIIQLDNAPCHTAKKLEVPENIILLFQPPYCPEVNPIERLWLYIKQQLKNIWFNNLDDVKNKVANILNNLQQDFILSLAGWDYIVNALSL
ncbi:MAG TPA: IS630 family transposase [Allocoleopsis sp.]